MSIEHVRTNVMTMISEEGADESVEMQPKRPSDGLGDKNSNMVNNDANEKSSGIWTKVVSDFMQNSTIHGLNHIVENTPYVARRCLWICIVICGFSLFCYQVTNSVLHFFDRPVSVNVKVNYNDTLRFPAVTICNHNDFRISKAADLGWYKKLVDTFVRHEDLAPNHKNGDGNRHSVDELDLSLREMLLNSTHEKEDLIVKCRWAGIECRSGDFTRVITDYGVCFTFNHENDIHKWVNQQGSSGGLRLTINIEQYEYTRGPTDGAGLKILLHSPGEFPLVKYLGQAIAPGSHTLVGITILEVHNLPEPHGKCDDSVKLDYFEHYSVSACHAECKQKEVRKTCKCRDFYLRADDHDTLPSCTLHQFITCVRPLLESLGTNDLRCECPVPCRQTIYDPLITAGVLSELDKDKLLTGDSTYTAKLTKKYHQAREKRRRVDEEIVSRDRKLISQMINDIDQLERVLHQVGHRVSGIRRVLDRLEEKYIPHVKLHSDVLAFEEYIIKHNFVRGFNVLNERYIQHVSLDYIPFLINLNISMYMLSNSNDTAIKRFLSQQIIATVETKLALLEIVKGAINESYTAYRDGIKLSVYNYTSVYEYDTLFSPPCFFDVSKHRGPDIYNRFNRRAIPALVRGLEMTKSMVLNMTGKGEVLNETEWKKNEELIAKGSRQFNYNVFMISDRIIEKPLNIVTNSRAAFDKDRQLYNKAFARIMQYVSEIENASMKFVQQWKHMVTLRKNAEYYLANNTNISKAQLADQVTSENVMFTIMVVKNLFSLVRSRDQDIHDELNSLEKTLEDLNMRINEKCAKPLYEKLKEDLKLYNPRNSSKKCNDLELVLKKLLRQSSCRDIRKFEKEYIQANTDVGNLRGLSRDEIAQLLRSKRLSHIVGTCDETLKNQFQIYIAYFGSFLEKNELNTEFIRDNFMSIDIFMRELSYEEIKQQVGYTSTNLWSDIGGSMGLFIGASVITAFEILDAFFYRSLIVRRDIKLRRQRRLRKGTETAYI
ncbi:uncharacterized protein LOC141914994 [Tubulanus polymorphus]|uniref:uncharacterized protein LOC141914994 n=1 Tax=Tubulanus polymorphus TaxID=672921 RepID=UPI003DA59CD7